MEPIRKFRFADDTLIQHASNVLSYLDEDLSTFQAFDPDLGETKHGKLYELTTWALHEGGDELNVARLGDYTEKLLTEINNAHRLYQQLRYWVLKAFPDRKAIQRQFGIGRYSKLTATQEGTIAFFASLSQTITEHRAGLDAVNTPEILLDSIPTQAETLRQAQQAQETKKGNREVDTEARITCLNELYDLTQSFNAAAEYVFFDSPASRDRYRLPGVADPVESEETDTEPVHQH